MRPLFPVFAIVAIALAVTGTLVLCGEPPEAKLAPYAGIVPGEHLPPELKQLVQRLGSADPVERAQATLELRAMGRRGEAAVPYLSKLLSDRSRIRIERDADGNDRGPGDRGGSGYFTCPGALAARALARAGENGTKALLNGMSHASDDVRRSALDGAGHAEDARVIPPIVRAIADSNGLVREAAEAAVLRRGSMAVDPLAAALRDGDSQTRVKAASLLSRLNNVRSTRALLEALGSSNPAVTAAVESALARMDERACLPSLIACLDDPSIRPHAIRQLARVQSAQKTAHVVEALGSSDARTRAGAAEALAAIGDATAAGALRRAQQDAHPEVRRAATDALAALEEAVIASH